MELTRRASPAVPGLKRSRWTLLKARVAARFGWLWRPQLYTGILLGFLLGRAMVGSQAALFGISFYAAVRGAGFSAAGAFPVAMAVLAGSATVAGLDPANWLWVLIAVCLSHVLATLLRIGRSGPSPLGAAVLGSVTAVIPVTMHFGQENVVMLVFLTGLAGVLALIFTLGITDAVNGRLLRTGGADSPVPAIVVLAAALSGLDGVMLLQWLSVRDMAAGLVVLTCAYAGGPPLGAAAGAVLGITFLAGAFTGDLGPLSVLQDSRGIPVATLSMAFVVGGMLGGTFRELRKPGVGMAFCLGLVTWAMASLDGSGPVFSLAAGAAGATLVFWILPRTWLAAIPAALGPEPFPTPGHVREPLPLQAFVNRLAGMSRVFKEVSRTFEQVATVEALPREQGGSRVFDQVAERVCSSCSMYRHCWEKEFDRTYQLYTDLWEQIDQDGPLNMQSVPGGLEQHCIYPAQVAFALNYLYDLNRSQHTWERRLEEGRTVVVDYLRNVARMMDRFVDEVGSGGGEARAEAEPVLRAVSGVARLAKRGSNISGDSYIGEALSSGRYLLALSDGMGVGRVAAAQSKHCVTLLREILKAGFATDVAVKTVNSALLLQSPDDSFATVDLALLDLTTGRAEFVKVGASPSFIKRGPDVTVVKTSAVPVGIINHVDVEPEFRLLRPGDVVVMITDGVWDVSKDDLDKERWLIHYLSRESSTDPEAVAESILARAVELMPDAGDDLSVLVARIESVGGMISQPEARPAVFQWAPVRRAPKLESRPAKPRK